MSDEIQIRFDLAGATLYAIVRDAAGDVWNGAAFVAPDSGDYGDYDIPLAAAANDGYRYLGDMPAVAEGTYTVEVYEQAGGAPDGTVDRVVSNGEIGWNGASEITLLTISNQIANIGFGTSADSVVATSDSNTPTGVETLTWEATAAPDGVFHEVAPDGGAIDQRYRFNVGGGAVGVSILWTGNVTTNNDSVEVFANTGTVAAATWQRIGTIDGKATSGVEIHTFNLVEGQTMTGVNLGEVEIKFESGVVGNVATNLRTDQILCQRQITSQGVGYANGSIWVDTNNGSAGVVPFKNGVADNPCSLWSDALILNNTLHLNRFELAPGTSIELTGAVDRFKISGAGATVALAGQSVSGAIFRNVTITGDDDGSNALATDYDQCELGDHTLGKFHAGGCHLEGTIVLAEAATYEVHDCQSDEAAGFDFGNAVAVTELHMYHHSGCVEIQQFADSGADVLLIDGDGELVINANCTAAGTITVRGAWTRIDNVAGGYVAGGGTINDDARYDVDQVGAACDTALTDYTVPTKAQMDGGHAEITAKTNLIVVGRMVQISPVLEDGEIELVAGDDYSVAKDTPVTITITDYTGMSVTDSGTKAELRIATLENYTAGSAANELIITDSSPSMPAADAVFTFELTAAETATLGTSPPADTLDHVFQLVLVAPGGEEATLMIGPMTVKGGIT